ncbi:MAG: aminopeptidase P family protein [Prevotellaceae bacterium]|nr:aminopeptidase P family protein [Prevotellaceae bacterium]
MTFSIPLRIEALRAFMQTIGIQAFIIPSADPHLSEYVTPHWKSREWISGFTGSAGTVVVTATEAGLWTDSRYFLQAETQLQGSGITLYKEKLPDTPTITAFLKARLRPDDTVGIDGMMFAAATVKQLAEELTVGSIRILSTPDPMDTIWIDRPPLPDTPVFVYDVKYAGQTCSEKIARIRAELKKRHANSLLLSALDEIAWTLNLRGSDVACNPVVISYLLITDTEVHYFIRLQKLTTEVAQYLQEMGVTVHHYDDLTAYLSDHLPDALLLNPAQTSYTIYRTIPSGYIVEGESPVALLKAVRNDTEIAGLHAAMLRDGIALVKFLRWLEQAVPTGEVTEMSADRKLCALRAEQPLFMGISFETIAGYQAHGAIVHYTATPNTDATLRPEGFLLIDSGAQYLDGTTDITRTIALGELTDEEKLDYTLVLRGHIDLAMAYFPAGTRGIQLDILARQPMWKRRKNYLHGTGHGVGHFLNVHEGPQTIRMEGNMIALLPGMLVSDEPGIYQEGSHGIRTENLLLAVPAGEGSFGNYLRFEAVTLCPICTKGVLKEMMTDEEIAWLNDYHHTVYEKLAPHLNKEEQIWLENKCTPLAH